MAVVLVSDPLTCWAVVGENRRNFNNNLQVCFWLPSSVVLHSSLGGQFMLQDFSFQLLLFLNFVHFSSFLNFLFIDFIVILLVIVHGI